MAAIYSAVQAAFDQRLATFANAGDYPVAWPNTRFRPPRDTVWLRPQLIPQSSRPATLGLAGLDRIDGDYRIDITAPIGVGTQAAATVADAMLVQFPRGLQLVEGSVVVHVASGRRDPARQDRRGLIVPVRVRWMSWVS